MKLRLIDELNEQITNAAERTQEESGISIINSGIKSNDNGYEATLCSVTPHV
jgi:hypothetical protein